MSLERPQSHKEATHSTRKDQSSVKVCNLYSFVSKSAHSKLTFSGESSKMARGVLLVVLVLCAAACIQGFNPMDSLTLKALMNGEFARLEPKDGK